MQVALPILARSSRLLVGEYYAGVGSPESIPATMADDGGIPTDNLAAAAPGGYRAKRRLTIAAYVPTAASRAPVAARLPESQRSRRGLRTDRHPDSQHSPQIASPTTFASSPGRLQPGIMHLSEPLARGNLPGNSRACASCLPDEPGPPGTAWRLPARSGNSALTARRDSLSHLVGRLAATSESTGLPICPPWHARQDSNLRPVD